MTAIKTSKLCPVFTKSVSLEAELAEEKPCFNITCAHAITISQIHPRLQARTAESERGGWCVEPGSPLPWVNHRWQQGGAPTLCHHGLHHHRQTGLTTVGGNPSQKHQPSVNHCKMMPKTKASRAYSEMSFKTSFCSQLHATAVLFL